MDVSNVAGICRSLCGVGSLDRPVPVDERTKAFDGGFTRQQREPVWRPDGSLSRVHPRTGEWPTPATKPDSVVSPYIGSVHCLRDVMRRRRA